MNFPKPKNTLISYAHDCKIFHLSPNSSSLRLTQPLLHPVADLLLLLRRCSSLTPAFFLQPISSIRSPSSPSSPSKVVLSLDPLSPISLFSPSRSDPSSLQVKLHIESGDIQGIIDPALRYDYDIQSMWKIAEKALMCVQPHGHMRPCMSDVLKEVQDSLAIEREGMTLREGNSDEMSRYSAHSSLNLGSLGGHENFPSPDASVARPTAR